MLKTSKLLLFVLFMLFSQLVGASESDSAYIQFINQQEDFGLIYEADGNVKLEYIFTNKGLSPLLVTRVFTTMQLEVEYPDQAVLPGKSAKITVTINPFKNVGHYNETVKIFSNATNSPSDLKITGRISGGTYTGSFKHNIGGLALKQSQINFGYIYKGEEATRFIPVLNNSDQPVKIEFTDVPAHIKLMAKFDELKPGKEGVVEVDYNTRELDDWDFVFHKIKLNVKSGDELVNGKITVTSNIREDFRLVEAGDSNALPNIETPVETFNFDTIAPGKTVNFEFPINNTGQADLEIRAVKPSCGCTAAMPKKTIIKPGKSTQVKVEFKSLGYSGDIRKGVTIITNDPINYKRIFWITGVVN